MGLGNIWRFPYITGKYGGAAFVLVYLAIVLVLGFSVMLAEMAIGRKAQLNAVGSFQKLAGGLWPVVGWMGIVSGFTILSFYGVVGGWTIKYFFHSFTGLMAEGLAGKAGDNGHRAVRLRRGRARTKRLIFTPVVMKTVQGALTLP